MYKTSLKEWVILLTILPTTLIGLGVAGYLSYNRHLELDTTLTLRAQSIIEPIAIASTEFLVTKNRDKLRQLINSSHRSQSDIVKSIAVFTRKNQIFVISAFHGDTNLMRLTDDSTLPTITTQTDFDDYIIFRTPIFNDVSERATLKVDANSNDNVNSTIVGYIAVQIDKSKVRLVQQSQIFIAFLVVLLGALISAIFTLRLIKNVTLPISSMVKAVDRIREGKLGSRVTGELIGELNFLRNGINAMAQSLGNYHNEMQRSVDQATLDLRASNEQLEIQNVELSLAKRKAQSANKVKSEFLANMSHELRTPLNGVLGFTRQILKTPLANIQRDYLQTIERSANNLLHIINDILDFSKLDADKMTIEYIPFSLKETIEESLMLLAPSAHQNNIELSINIPANITDSLIGDAMRIQQIFSNLISNALKFTEYGSVSADVSCEKINSKKAIFKISVTDTGIGMNDEQQQSIFEAFGQADNSITRVYGGTGLGLVICKRLANAMNGDIGFTSKQHQGATFWFTFQCEVNPIPVASPIEMQTLQHKKVLYLEKNEHSRTTTEAMMQHWKMSVTSVTNTQQLTDKLSDGSHYDYALIGHGMASSALTELRKLVSEVTPTIANIYLAVNSNSPSLQEALVSSGATSCISKPVTSARLFRLFQPDHLLLMDKAHSSAAERMPIKVLAVDDNPENLKLMYALLDELVNEIVLAKNGKEAVECCRNEMFSMIFMDIQMPIMDGITASEKISMTTINSSTPIIAVTANAQSDEKEKFKQQGFATYLAKPIDDKMLSHVIYEHCDLAQLNNSEGSSYSEQHASAIQIIAEEPNIHRPPSTSQLTNITQTMVIDWSLALKRTGNKVSLAKEMLIGLIDSLPETKKSIEDAITSQNGDKIKSLIHKLNGACCYTGVPNLCKISRLIEIELKKGASVEDLEPEFLEFFEHVEQLLSIAPQALELL